MIALALLASCMRPLPDPLAEQRVAYTELRTSALPAGWAPQASVVMGREAIDQVVVAAVSHALELAATPQQATFMGLTVTVTPQARIQDALLSVTDACESCLSLDVTLEGSSLLAMANRTGRRESDWGWTARLQGAMSMSLERESRRVMAGFAAPESWSVDLSLDDLPAGWNQALSGTLSDMVRQQVRRPELPTIALVQLTDDVPDSLAGVRLRAVDQAIALDFAFLIPEPGEVDSLPVPGAGWVMVMPEATMLGLLRAEALSQPYDPELPIAPELTGLALTDEGFELGVRAWPTRGRAKPKDTRIFGTIGLDGEGGVLVEATRAAWATPKGTPPDLGSLLLGRRLLDGLVTAIRSTMPATITQEAGGVKLTATPTRVSTEGGVLRMDGTLDQI